MFYERTEVLHYIMKIFFEENNYFQLFLNISLLFILLRYSKKTSNRIKFMFKHKAITMNDNNIY